MEQHTFMVTKVKLGKKGQLTIPKKVRDEDHLKEQDVFTFTNTPAGDMLFQRATKKSPENRIFDIIETHRHINWREAWKEVRAERRQSNR